MANFLSPVHGVIAIVFNGVSDPSTQRPCSASQPGVTGAGRGSVTGCGGHPGTDPSPEQGTAAGDREFCICTDLRFIACLLKCLCAMNCREVNLSASWAGEAASGTSASGSGGRGAARSEGGCPRGLVSNDRVLLGR